MSYTKRQLITRAMSRLGIAARNFDLQPADLQDALVELDMLMGEWDGLGIRFGYPLPSNPDNSDLDSQSNAPDSYVTAITSNLAVRISPDYGRPIAPALQSEAMRTYNTLLTATVNVPSVRARQTVAGAGNRQCGNSDFNYIPESTAPTVIDGLDME